jgi:hypothetical protein
MSDELDCSVQIRGVFPNDRDAIRMAVFDKDLVAAIEYDAPRRTQGESALVVVLRELGVLVVLGNLEHPEAHSEDGEHERTEVLQNTQSN